MDARIALFLLTSASALAGTSARAVNISNTWMLPEEGFPVFYRYFRDRISWYEADAVCQFHHANLVTVDSTSQYDAIRAYLKELDITDSVWIGLQRNSNKPEFSWTDFSSLSNNDHWQEAIPKSNDPLCVAMDPAADFRWHPLSCGGPSMASFICELPVPSWATGPKGCLLTELPSLTVLYIPEQSALELTSDCGLDGTKRIACKGNANRDEMVKQLACTINNDDFDERTTKPSALNSDNSENDVKTTRSWIWTSNTIDYSSPTRHRRETDTMSPISTESSISTSRNDQKLSSGREDLRLEVLTTTNPTQTIDVASSVITDKLNFNSDNIATTGKRDSQNDSQSSSEIPEIGTAAGNAENEYPSAISQGQLFSIIENGTVFDIIEVNETTEVNKQKETTPKPVIVTLTDFQGFLLYSSQSPGESKISQSSLDVSSSQNPLVQEFSIQTLSSKNLPTQTPSSEASPFEDQRNLDINSTSNNQSIEIKSSMKPTPKPLENIYTTIMYTKKETSTPSNLSKNDTIVSKNLLKGKDINDLYRKDINKEVEVAPLLPGSPLMKLNRTNRKRLPVIDDFDENDEVDLDLDNKLATDKAAEETQGRMVEIKFHQSGNDSPMFFVTTKVTDKNQVAKKVLNAKEGVKSARSYQKDVGIRLKVKMNDDVGDKSKHVKEDQLNNDKEQQKYTKEKNNMFEEGKAKNNDQNKNVMNENKGKEIEVAQKKVFEEDTKVFQEKQMSVEANRKLSEKDQNVLMENQMVSKEKQEMFQGAVKSQKVTEKNQMVLSDDLQPKIEDNQRFENDENSPKFEEMSLKYQNTSPSSTPSDESEDDEDKSKYTISIDDMVSTTEKYKVTQSKDLELIIDEFNKTTNESDDKSMHSQIYKGQFLPKSLWEETQISSSKKPEFEPEFQDEENLEGTAEPTYTEPQMQPRPNRQRQLTRSQRKTFYPYFFSRMLG